MTLVKDKALSNQELKADDRRWRAVLARDRRFDGVFVYAVRSTGIYCRPTCPSRGLRRQQVVFFAGSEMAERSGSRPCRRCRPEQQLPANRQLQLVRAACRHIQNMEEGLPTLTQFSGLVGTSPGRLQRLFKHFLGVSPRQYADACRQDRFKARLQEGWDIIEAMYDVGYGSSSRLYEGSTGRLGMNPASYRLGGRVHASRTQPCLVRWVGCWWPPPSGESAPSK